MKQGIHAMAIAVAVLFTGPAHAQTTSASPFQIVEASIDDIHTAFRSGRLTARQLVQSYLDRINAYDRQGPNINSVITINPNALHGLRSRSCIIDGGAVCCDLSPCSKS